MDKQLASARAWSFLDNLNEGVLITKMNGSIVYYNQAAAALLNLKQQDGSATGLELNQVVKATDWQMLLSPPAKIGLPSENGRFLSLHATPHTIEDQAFVQILVKEDTAVPASPETVNQLTALTRISKETDFAKQLQLLVDSLKQLGWNRVVLSLRDENFHPTEIITAGFTSEENQKLTDNMLPGEAWLDLFESSENQQYQRGDCFLIPETSAWSQKYLDAILPDPMVTTSSQSDQWMARDVLTIPLYNHHQDRIGLIGLDQPTNGRRPDKQALQTIELFAKFASSIIENAQLVQESIARNRESDILLEASNAFSSTLDKETILSQLGKHILQAVETDGFTIYQWNRPENNLIVLLDYSTHNQKTAAAGTAVSIPTSPIVEQLLHQEQTIINHAPANDPSLILRPQWFNEAQSYTSILLPLLLAGETYGFVHIIKQDVSTDTHFQKNLRLLSALTNQASTALETSLIFEDTYERERFYGALGNVSLALNSTLDKNTILNLICSESLRIFNVDGAYIWQYEDGEFLGSAAKGHGEADFGNKIITTADKKAFVVHLSQVGSATYINKINESDQFELRLPNAEQVKAVLGVPLEQEGNLIGVLVLVDNTNPDRFSYQDVTRATTFGVQVAIALQNAKLFEELRSLNEELDIRVANRTRALHEESNRVKILLRITSELSASLDQDRVLNLALNLVNEVVNATNGVILLVDQETNEFIFRASLSSGAPISPKGVPSGLHSNEGLAGWILENRSAVIVHDTLEDSRWVARATSSDYRSALGVPLISNEEVIGVLMMFHTEANAFTMQQLDLVEAAAIQVANAINNASLYELIFDQAEQLGAMLRSEIIQKANLQAIVESIADGIIVADNQNVIEMANTPASTILDIPREQLIGKQINELLGVYGQFGESWIETIADWAMHSERVEQWSYLDDQLHIEDKFISVHLSPVLSDGHFFGTVSIFRDITKEVEVDRLKSEFVSTVSHELRTPMTSIKGYADLMLMGASGPMTEPQLRYMQVIKNNADRLHMLVNDLLNISRIETGKITLDLRPVDMLQIVDLILEHVDGRIQHENKQLTLHTNLASSLPLVNADQARVIQIMTNLVDNAFNYTPENGSITITIQPSQSYVFISIADTGIGISKDNQEKIFDRFFRAEDPDVQKVPGTGLGLAIVQSLIEMHGGHLQLTSTLGEGSTFTFNLPVLIEDSDPT